MDKKQARRTGLSQRAALSVSERQKKSEIIQDKVISKIQNYHTIGCYVAMNDEVETRKIIDYCFRHNIQLAVPKTGNHTLTFHIIHSMNELEKGTYGVMEPATENIIPLAEIPCMIIPLSSFDRENHRTGYGAGYYDSVLTDQMNKIGIAYEVQCVDHIEVDSWDITLDCIITEK